MPGKSAAQPVLHPVGECERTVQPCSICSCCKCSLAGVCSVKFLHEWGRTEGQHTDAHRQRSLLCMPEALSAIAGSPALPPADLFGRAQVVSSLRRPSRIHGCCSSTRVCRTLSSCLPDPNAAKRAEQVVRCKAWLKPFVAPSEDSCSQCMPVLHAGDGVFGHARSWTGRLIQVVNTPSKTSWDQMLRRHTETRA